MYSPIFFTISIFSFARTTLLFTLFAKPFARQGPPTADIFALAIPLSIKILCNFSASVSNLLSIIANPFVSKRISI